MPTVEKEYGGLDRFRLVAAFMVVAIHTAPLQSVNPALDFVFTRILCRIAVPFFFMVTGQFVVQPFIESKKNYLFLLTSTTKKLIGYYLAATLLYLPINLYAGRLFPFQPFRLIRALLIDGSFYHLWYFPAIITGIWLIFLMSRKVSTKGIFIICTFLYIIGLLGDSYYGLIENIPILSPLYSNVFAVFSYTRNGLFYAPIFLMMGVCLEKKRPVSRPGANIFWLAISLVFLIVEGVLLHKAGYPRHDSMYISLIPCMVFLYQLLLGWNVPPKKSLRELSTWLYILHPMIIIVVRGIAKIAGLNAILIGNSILHYLAVLVLSSMAAVCMGKLCNCKKSTKFKTGRAWLEINRNHLKHNLYTLQALLPENCKIMPAVKANAYGHGSLIIAKELNRFGVEDFCVAYTKEGVALRKKGIKGNILVLGYTHPNEFYLLSTFRLTQTITNFEYAVCLSEYSKRIPVHIKIDTGMHRLGISCTNTEEIIRIFSLRNLNIRGIYSHLSTDGNSNLEDRDFSAQQARAFWNVVSILKGHSLNYGTAHLLSSNGLLNYPEFGGACARVGIALYGLLSNRTEYDRCICQLKPILSLKSRVVSVRKIHAGDAVGYDRKFIADNDMKIAVIGIGYGDGLPRSLSNGVGHAIIHESKVPIIGLVCMDQTILDVTEINDVSCGDEVVLIGTVGIRSITAYDIAEQAGTITNEVVSRLGERLERIIVGI